MNKQLPFLELTDRVLNEQDLRQQIEFFRQRLIQLVGLDNSAYEKLLSRTYERILQQREQMLENLLTRRRIEHLDNLIQRQE